MKTIHAEVSYYKSANHTTHPIEVGSAADKFEDYVNSLEIQVDAFTNPGSIQTALMRAFCSALQTDKQMLLHVQHDQTNGGCMPTDALYGHEIEDKKWKPFWGAASVSVALQDFPFSDAAMDGGFNQIRMMLTYSDA